MRATHLFFRRSDAVSLCKLFFMDKTPLVALILVSVGYWVGPNISRDNNCFWQQPF